MSRANGKGKIFETDVDRQDFIKTLAEACAKTGFEVHAYCLMRNHFHLVVETPNGNLVAGMRWLLSAYTLRFNPRHQRFGHVFSGRYKALVVDGSGNGYLRTVCDYVHLNPVRARDCCQPGQRLLEYPWSSFGGYLAAPPHRPAWLRVDRLLGEHGIARDTVAGRREFEQRLEARRAAERQPGGVAGDSARLGVWARRRSKRGCWSAWRGGHPLADGAEANTATFRYWQQEGWQRLWQLRRQPGRIEHDPRLPGHD
jgi:putative transposase